MAHTARSEVTRTFGGVGAASSARSVGLVHGINATSLGPHVSSFATQKAVPGAFFNSLVVDHDDSGMWDATNSRWNILVSGYYRVGMNNDIFLTLGHQGALGDLIIAYFDTNHLHSVSPNWYFNMTGQNTARGSFEITDYFTAGDWVETYYQNGTGYDSVWDIFNFNIVQVG